MVLSKAKLPMKSADTRNTQNFNITLSSHGYHGNSTRHILENCMSKYSPLTFRNSGVSSVFSKPCKSYGQKPIGVLNQTPTARLDRVETQQK